MEHARNKICSDITAGCRQEGIDRASELLRLAAGRRAATAAFERLGEAQTGSRLERRKALRCFRTGVEAIAVNAATALYLPPQAPLLEPLPLVLAAPEPPPPPPPQAPPLEVEALVVAAPRPLRPFQAPWPEPLPLVPAAPEPLRPSQARWPEPPLLPLVRAALERDLQPQPLPLVLAAPEPPPLPLDPPRWHIVYRQLVEEALPFEGVDNFVRFSQIAARIAHAYPTRNYKRRRGPTTPGRQPTQLELDCLEIQRECVEEANCLTGESRRTFRRL